MLPTYSHSRRASPDGSPEVAKKTRIRYPKRRSFLSRDEPKLHLSDLPSHTHTHATGQQQGHQTVREEEENCRKKDKPDIGLRGKHGLLFDLFHTQGFTYAINKLEDASTNVDNSVACAQKRERAAQLAPLEVPLPVPTQIRGEVAWLIPDLCTHTTTMILTHTHTHKHCC